MQAVVVENGTVRVVSDWPCPEPGPDEALVRVRLAGICATDLEIVRGYSPLQGVLGHEFVGEIASAPDAGRVGQRVVGTINVGCGDCAVCLSQGPEHCPNRTALGISRDGIFAEYATLPLDNLLPVPDGLPDEAAVFVEPLAAALRIREQIAVRPSARVAVVGPGRLGLLVAQVLALAFVVGSYYAAEWYRKNKARPAARPAPGEAGREISDRSTTRPPSALRR